ncbi:unnamed protein product [Rotaria sp. Silwood1]|nr:unnamed protein product [Rotaria sp. Silwood1]
MSFRFCEDDDFYSIPCSSSSFFVDDKLLHNELERTSIRSRTATGQFLCIDHAPRCHSFVNDLYSIDTNNFQYHPSRSFIDSLLSIEYFRAYLASIYILITGSINEIFRPYSNLRLRIGNAVDYDNLLKMEKMFRIKKYRPFLHTFRPTYPIAVSSTSYQSSGYRSVFYNHSTYGEGVPTQEARYGGRGTKLFLFFFVFVYHKYQWLFSFCGESGIVY